MKQILTPLKGLFTSLIIGTALVACSKEAPAPTDEKIDKGHEEPAKVEMTIRRGHLHGVQFHGDFESIIAPVQKFKFEIDENTKNWVRKDMQGNILTENNPVVMIEGRYYSLEIVYYNAKGERMNNEFTTKEMLPIHQHFFEVYEYTDTKTQQVSKDTEGLLEYTYRDTDPENIQIGQLVDSKQSTDRSKLTDNPLGLKGYFAPKKPYTKYSIAVTLFHVLRGTKNVNNQERVFYPFNKPGSELVARSTTDFSQKIPVYVITAVPDGGEEAKNRYYQDIASYYNITPQRVEELEDEARRNHDSANFYM